MAAGLSRRKSEAIIAAALVDGAIADAVEARATEHRVAAAAAIQRQFRAFSVRQRTAARARARRAEARRATSAIQATYRGHLARAHMSGAGPSPGRAADSGGGGGASPTSPSMGAPDPDVEAPRALERDAELEAITALFDDRTDEQRTRGAVLVQKFVALGAPHFTSPLHARAFLHGAHEFERRELAVRSRIATRIMAHVRDRWAATATALRQRHVRDADARAHVQTRERQFRRAEVAEEEQARHRLVQQWVALRHRSACAELCAALAEDVCLAEAAARRATEREQEMARAEWCTSEAAAWARLARRCPDTRPQTVAAYAVPARSISGMSGSLVHLRAMCEHRRQQQMDQRAEHARAVRDEGNALQHEVMARRTAEQAANFARSVKQRDEAKARRKHFILERREQNAATRARSRTETLASRRMAHEARHQSEASVFRRLLVPLRSPPRTPGSLIPLGGTSPSRMTFSGLYEPSTADLARPSSSVENTSLTTVDREVFDPAAAYGAGVRSCGVQSTPPAKRRVASPIPDARQQLDSLVMRHSRAAEGRSPESSPPQARGGSAHTTTAPRVSRSAAGLAPLHPSEARLVRALSDLHVLLLEGAAEGEAAQPRRRRVVFTPPPPVLEEADGGDALDAARVHAPDVDIAQLTPGERIVRWNELGRCALQAGNVRAADEHQRHAAAALRELEADLRERSPPSTGTGAALAASSPAEDRAARRTVSNLRRLTSVGSARVARQRKQLRRALQHLHAALTEEERTLGQPTPATLLNIAAVLTQIDKEGEQAVVYARAAVEQATEWCSEDVSRLAACSDAAAVVELRHAHLPELCVSALHNVAVAQAACAAQREIREGLLVPSERQSCRTTHAAALRLARLLLGAAHPLTAQISETSTRIAEALGAHPL